jgi:hypothetical protein
MLLFLFAIVIDQAPAAAEPPAAPPHIYLHPPTDGCDSRASSDEVVVCGNRDEDRYRLHAGDDRAYQDPAIRAQMKVAGGTLGVRADARLIGDAQNDVHFRDRNRHSDLRLHFDLPF